MHMQWADGPAHARPHVLGPPRPPRPLGRRPRGPRTWGRGMGATHCMRIGKRIGIYIYIGTVGGVKSGIVWLSRAFCGGMHV